MIVVLKTFEKLCYSNVVLQSETQVINNDVVIENVEDIDNPLLTYIERVIYEYVEKRTWFSIYELNHDRQQTSTEVRLQDNIDNEPVGDSMWIEAYYWNVASE